MGTDIHGWAEWKWRDSTARNPWGGIAPVPCTRYYEIFAVLADVRNHELSRLRSYADIYPLRGVPEPISPELLNSRSWDDHAGNMFNTTYYHLDELLKHRDLIEQISSHRVELLWQTYLNYLQHWSECWYNADVRIVIGFDN